MHVPTSSQRRQIGVPLVVGAALLVSALACALPTGGTPEPPPVVEVPPAEATPVPFNPTATPVDPAAPAAAPDVSYEGVSFSYDDSIAAEATAQTVPLEVVPEDQPYSFGGGTIPEHYRFDFVGYPHPAPEAYILVYPIAEFEAGHQQAAEAIADMRDALAARPNMPEQVSIIPFWNSGDYVMGMMEYMDFSSGSGVRALRYSFPFAIMPVVNQSLYYSYQGITSDGAYYLTAILPVSSPTLYDSEEEVPASETEWMMTGNPEDVDAYLDGITAQLEAQAPDGFTPSLTALDAMVQSISIQAQ